MKLMFKKVIVILMIICILFPMLFSNIALAVDEEQLKEDVISGDIPMSDAVQSSKDAEEEAIEVDFTLERMGNYVSNFAINFYKNWSCEDLDTGSTYGDGVSTKGEIKTKYSAYVNEISNPVEPEDSAYLISNFSWIDFCYKNSLSLDNTTYYPTQCMENTDYFEDIGKDLLADIFSSSSSDEDEKETDASKQAVTNIAELMNTGKILPGDILYTTEGEYLLYVGGTKVIYAQEPTVEGEGALKYEYLQDYFVKVQRKLNEEATSESEETEEEKPLYGVKNVYRANKRYIRDAGITESKTNLMFNNKGYYDVNVKYSGIAQGSYTGTTKFNVLGFIVNGLIDIIKWIVNLNLYTIRAVIVGWVDIIETFVQNIILSLSGHSSKVSFVDKWQGVSSSSYAGERVTVESLFFNQVPITDVNFFNFETAGGYALIEDGQETLLYNVRSTLAQWYFIIRNLCIGALLIILIYIGIRMAISSIAEQKAKYKQSLISWVTALGIVMFIHLFMYLILYLNDSLVGVIKDIGAGIAQGIVGVNATELSLYDAVRTKAYVFDFFEGTVGLIFYIILVYYLIRFFLIYVKRLVAVYILGLMGSFTGAKYAFDRATGRKSASLSKWIRDFSFNVLLQTIHALIYTMLMPMAFSLALTSISGLVIAIAILQLILQADKTFMKIFGVNSKGGLFDETDKPGNYWKILTKAHFIKGMVTAPFRLGKHILNKDSGIFKFAGYIKYGGSEDSVDDIEKKIKIANMERMGKIAVGLDKIAYSKASNYSLVQLVLPIHALRRYTNSDRQRRARLLVSGASYETKKNIYANIQGVKKQKQQRFTRKLGVATNLAKGAFNTIAGVGILTEGYEAGVHRIATGVSGIDRLRDKGQSKIYRRLQIPDSQHQTRVYQDLHIDSVGTRMSDIEIVDANADVKYEKTMKGIEGKQQVLEEFVALEEDINKNIDELNKLKQQLVAQGGEGNSPEEVNEKIDKAFNKAVNRTNKTIITASKIRMAIDRYLYKKRKTKIDQNDFDGIMDELQEVLDENDGNTIQLDIDTKNRLRAQIGDIARLDGKDRKAASAMLAEEISQPGVIEVAKPEFSDIPEVQELLEKITGNLKKISGLNQASIIKNKGAAASYGKIIKDKVKRIKEVQ